MEDDLKDYISKKTKRRVALERAFGSKSYAFFVSLSVLIGHITATEIFVMPILCILASIAFFTCSSIKHFLPLLLTFVYLVNAKHSPGVPYYSDYYSSGYRILIIVFSISLLVASFIYYLMKRVIPRIKGIPPMLIPTALLSVTFLLNGAGYEGYKWASLGYGAAQIAVYFVLFYAIYYGLKDEDTDGLVSHLVYLASLIAMVLIGEMIFMLTTYDDIISADGAIVKEMVILGWGVCNPIGFSIGILIPLFALGTQKDRERGVYYYLMMVTCTLFAILTQSRNALLTAGAAFVSLAFIGCFIGNNKRLFRVMGGILSVGAVITAFVFYDKISSLMASLINMGFADNGRFSLWKLAIDYFKDSPVFGIGFFSFDDTSYYNVAGFLPHMAHNTLMILLSSTGTVGTVAYAIYRISTLKPFFKKITLEKMILFTVVAYFILSSLVDNFVFYFYTAFLYITVLAVTQNIYDRQVKQNEADIFRNKSRNNRKG